MPERGTRAGGEGVAIRLYLLGPDEWGASIRRLLAGERRFSAEVVAGVADISVDAPGILVVDESKLDAALGEMRRRELDLPVMATLDRISAPTLDRILAEQQIDVHFFSRAGLEADILEQARFVQLLREEAAQVSAATDDEPDLVGSRIDASGMDEGLNQLTSLFVDAPMRRFIHELRGILKQIGSSGLVEAGARFWHSHDPIVLFRELDQWARNNPRTKDKSQEVDQVPLSAEAANTLEAITRRPSELAGLRRLHVLIEGETGTGKTLVARWIHRYLGEVTGFRHINVTALPPELVENELFGAVRGAYTDSVSRPGELLMSYGRVLFLDEIGDLPLAVQGKLLVYLDDYQSTPLGWPFGHPRQHVVAPTHVVAGTNRPIKDQIASGEFREDLFHRFTYKLHIPPLRERKADLPLLADLLLQNKDVNEKMAVKRMSPGALKALSDYRFPGNFRELEDVLGKACLLARQGGGDTLEEKHVYRAIIDLEGKFS